MIKKITGRAIFHQLPNKLTTFFIKEGDRYASNAAAVIKNNPDKTNEKIYRDIIGLSGSRTCLRKIRLIIFIDSETARTVITMNIGTMNIFWGRMATNDNKNPLHPI